MGQGSSDYSVEGFGQVSQRMGRVFRTILLVATTIGIFSLFILMAFVAVDAFQPFDADSGWYAIYLLVLVLPTAVVGGYVRRRTTAAGLVGVQAIGIALAGGMVGAGVSVLFIEVVAMNDWFAYVFALAVTLGLSVGYRRLRTTAGGLELGVVTAVGGAGALLAIPQLVSAAPILPARWILAVLSVGVPIGVAVFWGVRDRLRDRDRLIATGGTVALGVVGGFVAPLIGIGAVTGVIMSMALLVPLGLYLLFIYQDRTEHLVGMAIPAVLLGGFMLARTIADFLGFAGPPAWFDWQFLTSSHNNIPEHAGVYPALVGSVMLMVLVVVLSFPIGVGAAIYLEEYAGNSWFTRIVQVNIANLAGVPSVVYGLLALGIFINLGGFTTGSLIVAGIALSLLILPIVIISAQEAIRSVPDSLRQASYGMGATRYQTVRRVVLPRALPGILTGTILALGRALGETAPLIMIGAPAVGSIPDGFNSKVVALPMQVFTWASTFASPEFFSTALAAGVVTLLIVLLMMNSIAIVVRNKYERRN